MGLKAWLQDWLAWVDVKIYENRPLRRPSAPPPKTVFEPITEEELRLLCSEKFRDRLYAERLIRDHSFNGTGFEFGGKWFQIVGSHKK